MIEAFGKNIIVKPICGPKKTIIELVDEKPVYYEVLSVGNDVKEILIGDNVLINTYGVQEKIFNNERIYVTSTDQIFGKLTQ